MPTWDAKQYLQFGEERTQACRDLVTRIALSAPAKVIDLGCGPGNSTDVLAARWPQADLTGLDSSATMIDAARRTAPNRRWIAGDIAGWSAAGNPFDLVFSNAALQWVPDHARLYPHLLAQVAPGGALAVQVPCNIDAPAHRLARELAASAEWSSLFPPAGVREWHVHEAPFYYDLLAPRAAGVDMWETEYQYVLPGAEAVVEWYKGTGLRPFLEALPEADRDRFLATYLERLRPFCPPRADGRTLFPFRRLFVVAYRGKA